jgi:hypothetical protein
MRGVPTELISLMSKATYLTTQLRESAPYLKDAGWHESAKLVVAAANEIEALRLRVEELTFDVPVAQANENWPQRVKRSFRVR